MLSRVPHNDADALRIRFWGVRGSMPVAGQNHLEFGGHTPCIEVRCGARLFVVDAGTGLAAFGAAPFADLPAEIDILLSHLHLDHITGLPFFRPSLTSGYVIRLHCGNLDGQTAEESLACAFGPPLFPVRLEEMPARFEHVGFRAGETLRFGHHSVATHLLNHPGGATGYRFNHRGRSVCYLSDIEHSEPWPAPDVVQFAHGADLVIYDGMFSESEYPSCKGWGHSTWEKGIELCQAAGAASLAVIHHHPAYDDAVLRQMEADMQAVMPTAFLARENQEIAFSPIEARSPA
jgi:phosphoribosyl 1,2-cyclic phosphodiesterase